MRIWIDITNSPHVIIFEELISELSKKHQIIITTRELANTIDLLNLKKIRYNKIGGHAGKNIFYKLLYFPKRILKLYKFLHNKNIDIAISQSSFYSPITAWLLRIPSIYMNDNEHAKGNWISFLFATKTLIPEYLENLSKKQKWHFLTKIILYKGTKEAIYLKNIKITKYNYNKKKKIYFRPEPWTAQYYKGEKFFFDKILLQLSENYEIHILPRDKKQVKHYSNKTNPNIIIENKPLTIEQIATNCDLFIGAGGTMTREMAIIGIPTISIYQDKLLEVDKFLISNKFMYHNKQPNIKFIEKIINIQHNIRNKPLLEKGEETYQMIKNILLTTAKNK